MKSLFGLMLVAVCFMFGCAPSDDNGSPAPENTSQIQTPSVDVAPIEKV